MPYTPPAARPVTITWTTRLTAGHYSGARLGLNPLRKSADASHMRSEIDRARAPSQNMGGSSRRPRFGLAAFGALLVAGIAVGLAVLGSTDRTQSSKLTIRRAVAAGAPVSQASRSSSSAVPRIQVAHGVLTPAVRDMQPRRGHWNMMFKKVAERSRGESLNIPDRRQGSALVQHGAPKNQMPS